MIITFNYLKFYNKWYTDEKKKTENDSINQETMLPNTDNNNNNNKV